MTTVDAPRNWPASERQTAATAPALPCFLTAASTLISIEVQLIVLWVEEHTPPELGKSPNLGSLLPRRHELREDSETDLRVWPFVEQTRSPTSSPSTG